MNGAQILGIIAGAIGGWIIAGLTTSPRIVGYIRPGVAEVEPKMPGCLANLIWLILVGGGAAAGFVVGSIVGG